MSNYIERDVELLITGRTAKLNDNVYLFKGDRDIQLNITITDTNMKFSRGGSNVLTPLPKDCYARVGIIKPDGTSIVKDRVPIVDNIVRFVIESTMVDELEEVGEHKLQIRIYANDDDLSPRWTLPAAAGLTVVIPDVDFDVGEMGRIRFDMLSVKDLGTLYKDNSVEVDGLEFIAELNLNDVEYILANYVVNSVSYSDTVTIKDIENSIIQVPFRRDVVPAGEHQFEVVARMKNGDVKPSQTFKYKIEKSLESPDSVQADTNYPILIELIDTVKNINANVNKLISDTKIELQDYKETKNSEINQDLNQYKTQATESINSYKSAKDAEINQSLNSYKTQTTTEIDDYKDAKDLLIDGKLKEVDTAEKGREIAEQKRVEEHGNREASLNELMSQATQDLTNYKAQTTRDIDSYKNSKDAEIDQYKSDKNTQIDNYVADKNKEIDSYKNAKDNLINEKLNEVETSEANRVEAETLRQQQHESREQFLNGFENRLGQAETDIEELKNKPAVPIETVQQVNKNTYDNKRQDFYINALYNENTDGRLSIEEEGNDLKLEGSKQGLVEIEKVVGNTLVNRVSEPMRELTLNGDIDIEGTFVTTIECVDNGLVDVMCEGNTLVNLVNRYDYHANQYRHVCFFRSGMLKPNTRYSAIITNPSNEVMRLYWNEGIFDHVEFDVPANSTKVFTHTTKTKMNINVDSTLFKNAKTHTQAIQFKVIFLEGDWTNKELPTSYFEGMKSVGQDDENGHKIEILSHNGNLYKRLENSHYKVYGSTITIIEENENGFIYKAEEWDTGLSYLISTEGLFKNKKYRLSFERNNNTPNAPLLHSDGIKLLDSNKSFKEIISWDDFGYLEYDFKLPDSFEQGDILEIRFKNGALSAENGACNICINEIGVAKNTVISKLNKKEILINEPLRSLPNGVKDTPVKIDGKWYAKRVLREEMFDGSEDENWQLSGFSNENFLEAFWQPASNINQNSTTIICDKFGDLVQDELMNPSKEGVGKITDYNIRVIISKSKATNIAEFRTWLQQNPIKIIYQLATPIYEPLEIEPTLNTYNDITHISNNSIIPCNMKVKNTGFSCRALTSGGTYTVVHNGGEGVTSNIDATDNMVRLYGKGKKVSDVMVLDGTVSKTYGSFEGMQSTFEDKLITQEMVDSGEELAENLGKYRVGVKVVGKNLFDEKSQIKAGNWLQGEYKNGKIHLKNDGSQRCVYLVRAYFEYGKMYCLSYHNLEGSSKYVNLGVLHPMLPNGNVDTSTSSTFNCGTRKFNLPSGYYYIRFYTDNLTSEDYYVNYMLEEIELISSNSTPYEPYKEYKTSILLSSPLTKFDEICVQNGQLGHLHNSTDEIDYNNLIYHTTYEGFKIYECLLPNVSSNLDTSKINIISDNFKCKSYDNRFDNMSELECYLNNGKKMFIISNKELDELKGIVKDSRFIYLLSEPYLEPITPTLPKWVLDSFNDCTLHIDSAIPCQSVKASYTGKLPSVYKLESDISTIEEQNVDIIATSWDTDYRVCEIEWVLEDAVLTTPISLYNIKTGGNTMALSRFEQAKIIILGDAYYRPTFQKQLETYLKRNYLTQEEFDTLVSMMDAREAIKGE